MTDWRKIITVLIGVLSVCAISRADMMALSQAEVGCRQPDRTSTPTDLRSASLSSPWAGFPGVADIDSSLAGFLSQPNPEVEQTSETKPAHILTDRQNSLTLCLYALLGLGLCQSAPLVKKFHLGCIPDWYHNGGPSQIGHSVAISPDCLPLSPVFCFIQPESRAATQDLLPQHRRAIVVSLWRQSQFTPTALASRGPPSMS